MERYALARFQGRWSRETWRSVLGTLDLLDRLPSGLPTCQPRAVLDVGSSHWMYVGALAAWLRARGAGSASLTGVELDAFRLYRNLRTPASLARYHSRIAGEGGGRIRYIEGSAEEIEGEYDFVTWFFPFLFEGTVRSWGLPVSELEPERLARAVFDRMTPGGACLIVNQGEEEAVALAGTLARAVPRACCVWRERVSESLHAADHPLFAGIWVLP